MEKNLFEEAYDYYFGEDYDLDEAIKKFEEAGDNGFPRAYYELSDLYAMNYTGAPYRKKEFECMKKAAELGYENAYYELAKMYDYNRDKYGVNDLKKAMHWYAKASGFNSEASKRFRTCLDKIEKASYNQGLMWHLDCMDSLLEWYEIVNDDLKSKIRNLGITLFDYPYKKKKCISDYDSLEKYDDFLKKYAFFCTRPEAYDDYYKKKGDLVLKTISSKEGYFDAIDIYNNIKNIVLRKSCLSSVYERLAIYYIDKNDTNFNADIVSYLEKIYVSDMSNILLDKLFTYVFGIIDAGAEDDCLEPFVKFFEKHFFDEPRLMKIKDKLSFMEDLKLAINDDKDALLRIANAYMKGKGTEQNKKTALDMYLYIFCKWVDEKAFKVLFNQYETLDKIESAIYEYASQNGINNINKVYEYLGTNDFNYFEDYLKKSGASIRLNGFEKSEDLEPFYHDNHKLKCYDTCNTNKEYCDWWYKYWSKCANLFYEKKYYNGYCRVNDSFFDKVFFKYGGTIFKKKNVIIVLVGCGNFYELSAINEIARNCKMTRINLIVLDRGIWQKNAMDKIKNRNYISKIWFKKCDFYEELKKDIYSKADIIYFSRCIIPYDYKYIFNYVRKKIEAVIKPSVLTVFSEVLDISTSDSVRFELDFRDFLHNNYLVDSYFIRNGYDFGLQEEKMYEQVNYNDKKALQYYLFILKGVKK